MFGKAPLTSRGAMMRSTGSIAAGWYVGVQVGADAAWEDGPDDFDLRDPKDYGAPVVRVCPVPFFGEGADNGCPVWW